MKKQMKWLIAGAALTAAAVAGYRKMQRSYELLSDGHSDEELEDQVFEPVDEVDDGFDYYVDGPEQIMFYE